MHSPLTLSSHPLHFAMAGSKASVADAPLASERVQKCFEELYS